MKLLIKRLLPASIWQALRAARHRLTRLIRRLLETCGLVVARSGDFYSPLPSEFSLQKTRSRWAGPSSLRGVAFNLDDMKRRLRSLVSNYWEEFAALPPFQELREAGYGPGYTHVDAFVLYAMIRDLKPRRYIEIGSGLSTFYCDLARRANSKAGQQHTEILCIEPYPYRNLRQIEQIQVIQELVQDVPLETFTILTEGDILFIDSSHVVRLGGDVPYLFLEVLPAIPPGVHIHVHDISFPFNVPYPPEFWTLGEHPQSPHWPMYWTEPMLLQAFLAFNSAFEITLSCPMLRHFDEEFCRRELPIYQPVTVEPNAFSSIWLKRCS